MHPSLPLNILAACCFIGACNSKPPVIKDSKADYKNYRNKYARAKSPEGSDSAYIYYSDIANNSRDSLWVALAYTEMGIIQYQSGDYYGSQESLVQSLDHLNENNKAHRVYLACAYNELGLNSTALKNFDEAIHYSNKAIEFSNDDSIKMINFNNLAIAYREKKEYDSAIAIYNTILQVPENTPMQYARVLSNQAYTKWLKDPVYDAVPELKQSLQIRKQQNDEEGLLASYQQLSDYYTSVQPDSTLYYAHLLYSLARKVKSPDDELNGLSAMTPLSDAETARKYFQRYKFLNDSIQTARASAKNQFALIRYNTERYKAEKLSLQKENAETQLRVIWLQAGSVVLFLGAVLGFAWYRKRKQQAMRQQQLKTSQKVHDVVANGLYTIINKIEHEQTLEKEQLLDDMETLYEQSRNISYERDEHKHSEDVIPVLLKSFSTPETRVSIVGYSPNLWNTVSTKAQNAIKFALQNLMINMKKHSKANNVVIKFQPVNKKLKILYTDDGTGFPEGFRYGNGLRSTETRIKSIRGTLTFDFSAPTGVKIEILIPIESTQ